MMQVEVHGFTIESADEINVQGLCLVNGQRPRLSFNKAQSKNIYRTISKPSLSISLYGI
jgi:hypothetical protein